MRRNLLSELQKYIMKNRHKRLWRNILIVLACIVVFCTTYALILPAITLERQDANQVVGDTEYKQELNTEDDKQGTPTLGDGEIDFKEKITDVTVQYRAGDWEQWKDLKEGDTVKENEKLRFDIKYKLPGNTLSYESPNIVYQLPDNIKIDTKRNGKVYDSSNREIGIYNISEDGKIKITFNEDYIKKSEDGQEINGHIAFESSISDIKVNEQGKSEIKFNDNETVTIKVDSEKYKTGDIKVEKKASKVENGKVTYTIIVTSEKGTETDVNLSDVMEKMKYNGEFKITDKDGNEITNIEPPKDGANKFDIKLPKMNAGDKYTITYTAEFDEITNGTIQGKNKVNVSSTDSNNNEIKSSSEVTTDFTNEIVKKSGVLSDDKSKITWTIQVNKSKQDISGYKLTDILNGENFEGEVEISSEGEEPKKIELPYVFPEGSNKTYTIKYTTDSNRGLANGSVVENKATIKKDSNDKGISDTGSVWVDGFNPLKKSAENITLGDDSKTVTIKWKVLIDTTDGELPEGWIYSDYLNNDQYFTEAQKHQLEEKIKALDSSIKIKWKNKDNTDRTNGFELEFPNKLEKGKKIEFNYESTGEIEDNQTSTKFTNSAKIKSGQKEVHSQGEITYKAIPVVSKYDLKNNSTNDTKYNYDDVKNGILGWGFKVTIPKNASGQKITITEKLPEGVSLLENEGLKVLINDVSYLIKFDSEGKSTLTIDNYTMNFTNNSDNTVIIEIPAELTTNVGDKLKEYKFEIQVKINESYSWVKNENSYVGTFKNEVYVKGKDDKELGNDKQTQTIIKEYTENDNILKKSHQKTGDKDSEFENNTIPYSIVINKEGKDLLEGSDTLTLKDVLKFQHLESDVFNISLMPESLHVYNLNKDGTKGEELSPSEFKYTFVPESVTSYGTTTSTYTLLIEVPDNTPLIVEYKYKVNSNLKYQINLNNTVSLEGKIDNSYESKDFVTIKISESSAGAEIDGVVICKVDKDNNAITLPGAKFKLYRWDNNKNEYVIVKNKDEGDVFTTDENGEIKLSKLDYNTAYKLVEEKSPDGYIKNTKPYYFYVFNSDKAKYPECKPNSFKGTLYTSGSVIYIKNELDNTKITVNKKWFKHDGTEVTGQTGSQINFELWRKIKKSNDLVNLNIDIDKYNQWNHTIKENLCNSTYSIEKGSTVILYLTNSTDGGHGNSKNYRDIYINSKSVEPTKVVNGNGNIRTYEYTITISDDIDITGGLYWGADLSVWSYDIKIIPPKSDSADDPISVVGEKYGDYVIRSTDNWSINIDKLPKEGVDNEGNKIYYTYYVKERESTNYDTSYENNEGITEGTITINNKLKENIEFELPETGILGGNKLFILGGLLLMAGSLIYIHKHKRGV